MASIAFTWSAVSSAGILSSSFGGFMPASSSRSISPSSASHAENRRTPRWRDRAVAASAPPSSTAAVNFSTVARSNTGSIPAASHQRRNAATPAV